MANTFLKPTVINRMALKLLQREVVLPRLVWNFADAEFRGAYGDTVTLRLPAVLAAREYGFRNNRSSEIVIDDLTEHQVPQVGGSRGLTGWSTERPAPGELLAQQGGRIGFGTSPSSLIR